MSMHPLLRKKFTHVFHLADVNGDNRVGRSDYESLADRFAKGSGIAHGDPLHEAVRQSMLLAWSRIRGVAGVGDDDLLDLEQFLDVEHKREAFHNSLKPEEYHDTIALFALMGGHERGYVTIEQYIPTMSLFGMRPEQAKESFPLIDVNGDGRLTLAELIEMWEQFFTSTDPASPGNHLFGKLD